MIFTQYMMAMHNKKNNCMIGSLKPTSRETLKPVAIGADPHVTLYHYQYGTTYEKIELKTEWTETPIYNMAVEPDLFNTKPWTCTTYSEYIEQYWMLIRIAPYAYFKLM